MRTVRCAGLLLAAALLTPSCVTRHVSADAASQAYYRTAWPTRDASRTLEEAFRSVKRIQVTGFYETFRFDAEDAVTEAQLRQPATYRRARENFTFDHAKAGTATAVARVERSLRLLTNAHVTRMPDTVVSYFPSPPGAPRFVESVAILRAQSNIILDVPGASQFRVTAADSAADLALLAADLDPAAQREVPLLTVRPGDPARLSWGSFVYVMGYPRGNMMVTSAIVSSPRQGSDNGFLLDGAFNRGISGGPIFAVRGDTGALEWVGVVMAASAQTELRLVPEQRAVDEHGMLLPYDGRLFLEEVRRIDYGITHPVSMTTIARFLRRAGHPLPGTPRS